MAHGAGLTRMRGTSLMCAPCSVRLRSLSQLGQYGAHQNTGTMVFLVLCPAPFTFHAHHLSLFMLFSSGPPTLLIVISPDHISNPIPTRRAPLCGCCGTTTCPAWPSRPSPPPSPPLQPALPGTCSRHRLPSCSGCSLSPRPSVLGTGPFYTIPNNDNNNRLPAIGLSSACPFLLAPLLLLCRLISGPAVPRLRRTHSGVCLRRSGLTPPGQASS